MKGRYNIKKIKVDIKNCKTQKLGKENVKDIGSVCDKNKKLMLQKVIKENNKKKEIVAPDFGEDFQRYVRYWHDQRLQDTSSISQSIGS